MEQEQQYAEIVKRFADRNGEFYKHFRNTLRKYRPTLSDDSIDDLYQDSFIAAQKNLMEGRIRENTSWNSYLIAIGLNLATHEYREFGTTEEINLNGDYTDDEVAVYNTPEVQRVFGRVLEFMKEKCRKILEWTLYGRMSSEDIAIELGSTSRSIITQRNRCKNRLVELVKAELKSLDYEIEEDSDEE
ncbi:MAG: sigma-70 family RNA polymerase sigma factor [Muribaculum sp.]|nr:sigma-70 family RNA polymerase sigma factor [Muribaculum sp.]